MTEQDTLVAKAKARARELLAGAAEAPWAISGRDKDTIVSVPTGQPIAIVGVHGQLWVYGPNAALIAEAPELLAALSVTAVEASPEPQDAQLRDLLRKMHGNMDRAAADAARFGSGGASIVAHSVKVEIDSMLAETPTGEVEALRVAQASLVMPMIGPLLDAWDGVPNDLRGELEGLGEYLEGIAQAMDDPEDIAAIAEADREQGDAPLKPWADMEFPEELRVIARRIVAQPVQTMNAAEAREWAERLVAGADMAELGSEPPIDVMEVAERCLGLTTLHTRKGADDSDTEFVDITHTVVNRIAFVLHYERKARMRAEAALDVLRAERDRVK